MPYIGQSPATGEANSFKTLDDITSYTLTFDGSSASTVSVANDTITERNHRFVTGQRVTYNDGGGTSITGLSDGVYYIIVEDKHTIKLATNANNAAAGTAINLTGLGVGSSHTLNVAFDGVNTKFKATVNNGTRADITSAPQLMLSINGVLQQPHNNTTSPTTGYAVDHTSTIIFSAAPATSDQFFASLVASSAPTFDISDNVVDNFTGDGSATDFTLSKAPPNNESVLVTIDGVVQYPDDTGAVRAYTVSENILTFASAPGNGVEIQVRHIGFAGASTGGISGFYGRTGNAVLKNTDNIVFNNATASGTVQAANVTVTGDLTVNGTTTTLDTELTSVDKLEVDANNTTVAAAVTQRGNGDILNLYDGGTEVFSVLDGGAVRIGGNAVSGAAAGVVLQDGTGVIATRSSASSPVFRGYTQGDSSANFTVKADGKLLLGTETEGNANADNLTVADSANSGITIRSGSSNIGSIFFSDATSGGGEYAGFIDYNHSSNQMSFGTAETTRVTLKANGNLGIGTDNPQVQLHLTAADPYIRFQDTAAPTGHSQIMGTHQGALVLSADESGSVADSHLRFDVDGTERLRIDSGGVVKVVSGDIRLNGDTNSISVDQTTATKMRLKVHNVVGLEIERVSSTSSKLLVRQYSTGDTAAGYPVLCDADDSNTGIFFPSADNFGVTTGGTERLRITSEGSALLTTDGQSAQYSYAMKLGQSAYNPNDATGPHYGLWVRQLGPRYELNYGVYSEVEDDNGFYGGETLDGLTSVRGIGVYGASTTSNQARQKGIGVYGKAFNTTYNYNSVIGVRGRAETGTTTFTNNDVEKSFGGHFVATGKSNVVGVYADAYLDGSPGANQVAIPLLVSSNGSEKLRVTSDGKIGINKTSPNSVLHVKHHNNNSADITIEGGGSGNAGIQMIPGGQTNSYFVYVDTNRNFRIQDHATERFRITSGGKIGIGHAYGSQITKELTIRPVNDGGIRFVRPGDNAGSPNVHLDLTTTTSGSIFPSGEAYTVKYNTYNNDQIFTTYVGGGTGGNISFKTATQGNTPAERLRITSDGLVGIDVASPTANLDVNGILQLRASGNTTYATRIYSRLDSTHCSVIESYLNSNTAFELMGSYADGGGTNPRVVISSGGKPVGINTTAPSSQLHINNGGDGSSAIEIDGDYLTVSPSLNLDFAKSRKLDSRIYFHRDSIGTYFDANGLLKVAGPHEPRFDHDPRTGQSLGLMIEETRTNHVNSSENPAEWNRVHTAANETTYKIKGIPTVKIIDGSSDGDSPYLSGGTYGNGKVTMSMYIDAVNSTSNTVRMYLFGNGYGTIAWSLSGNVAATAGGFSYSGSNHSNGVAQTIDCGGGIYRLVMTFDYNGGNTTSRFYVTPSGADSDYVYIAGMQLESGGFATSYIPTSGSPVTRSQDRAEIKYDGWYNDESYKKPSTFAGRFRTYNLSATRMVAEGSNGSTLKDFSVNTVANSAQLQFAHRYTANNSYGNTSNAGVSINTDVNFAFSYDGTDGSLLGSANRTTPFTGADDLGTTSQIGGDRMRIGSRGDNSIFLNGTIAQLRYFPVQATSAQLLAQQ